MCEVNFRVKFPRNDFVCGKLRPVVCRYRPYRQPALPYESHHGICQWNGLLSRIEFLHEHKAALPLNQSNDGTFAFFSDDGVHLPVSYGLSIVRFRSFVNGEAVGNMRLGGKQGLLPWSASMPEVLSDVVPVMWGKGRYPVVYG